MNGEDYGWSHIEQMRNKKCNPEPKQENPKPIIDCPSCGKAKIKADISLGMTVRKKEGEKGYDVKIVNEKIEPLEECPKCKIQEKPLFSDEEIVKIWYFKKFKPLVAEADIMKAMHYEYKHSYDCDEVLEILKEARKQAKAEKEDIVEKLEQSDSAYDALEEKYNFVTEKLEKRLTDGSKEQAFSIIEDIKKITGCESMDALEIVESVENLKKQLKEASSETKEDFEHEKIITEFADDSTKRLLNEIENLKQRLNNKIISRKELENLYRIQHEEIERLQKKLREKYIG